MPTIAGDRGTRVNLAGTTGDRRGSDRRRRLRARGRLLRVRLRCNHPWHDRPWYDRPADRRKVLPTSARRPPPDSGPARAATGRQVDDRLQLNRPPGGGRHAQRHSSSIRTVTAANGMGHADAESVASRGALASHRLCFRERKGAGRRRGPKWSCRPTAVISPRAPKQSSIVVLAGTADGRQRHVSRCGA